MRINLLEEILYGDMGAEGSSYATILTDLSADELDFFPLNTIGTTDMNWQT